MRTTILPLLASAAVAMAMGPVTGDSVPVVNDFDVVHPLADSFQDFKGRVIVLEFFTYW